MSPEYLPYLWSFHGVGKGHQHENNNHKILINPRILTSHRVLNPTGTRKHRWGTLGLTRRGIFVRQIREQLAKGYTAADTSIAGASGPFRPAVGV